MLDGSGWGCLLRSTAGGAAADVEEELMIMCSVVCEELIPSQSLLMINDRNRYNHNELSIVTFDVRQQFRLILRSEL